MAYRGTITVAGLPAKSLHVYDEGLVLAKARLVRFLIFLPLMTILFIVVTLQLGSLALIPLIAVGLAIPRIWKSMTQRKPPANLDEARQARGLQVIGLDEISSANFEEGSGGKRTLTVRTRQGVATKYVWWTESSVGSNPDTSVQPMLAPILTKPRSFY